MELLTVPMVLMNLAAMVCTGNVDISRCFVELLLLLLLLYMAPNTAHSAQHTKLYYPVPDTSGDGVLFSVDFFVYIFVYIFVSLLARLRENSWTNLHTIFMEGMT